MKNKNKRKYKDGDRVIVGGYEFVVISYHYPSMNYALKRSDGLNIFVKEDEFDTIYIPIPLRGKSMALNYEEIVEEKNESISRLKSMLYNAIIAWYDDSLTEYHGLDDEKFVERVCSLTGMTEEEYQRIIL